MLNVQVSSAVTTTGYYPWSVTLTLTFTGVDTITRTVNGSTIVVANGSSDPYGQGFGIAGLDQLVSVTGGVLWVSGSGSGRFFANGTTAGTFINPANDFGTLTQSQIDSTYTYTTTNDSAMALQQRRPAEHGRRSARPDDELRLPEQPHTAIYGHRT